MRYAELLPGDLWLGHSFDGDYLRVTAGYLLVSIKCDKNHVVMTWMTLWGPKSEKIFHEYKMLCEKFDMLRVSIIRRNNDEIR